VTEHADRTDYGAVAQVGYLLTASWEVFGRYGVIFFDEDAVAGEDTIHEIAGGVNYYLGPDGSYKHSAKVTIDAVYLPNGFPSNQTGLGILDGDEDELVLRTQFTLAL
jgi:hypothetical protein